jgi:uncharacterized protein YkwD
VHHIPAGPPLSARIAEALSRWAAITGRAPRRRSGRLALGALVSTVLTALVLAFPVMADSSVALGEDGQPLSSSAFAGLTSTATFSSATGEASAAPSATGSTSRDVPTSAPSTTGTPPVATAPTVPDPATSAPTADPDPADAETEAAEQQAEAADVPTVTPPPAAAAPAATAAAASGPEEQVLALVNAERAAAGCGALAADDRLAAVARAHSEDMRDRGFFDHVNLDGLDPFDRAARAGLTARAENIARGQQDAAAVMESWMNSPGHRANILDCGLTRLGVGVASGGGGPWWTQLFA